MTENEFWQNLRENHIKLSSRYHVGEYVCDPENGRYQGHTGIYNEYDDQWEIYTNGIPGPMDKSEAYDSVSIYVGTEEDAFDKFYQIVTGKIDMWDLAEKSI